MEKLSCKLIVLNVASSWSLITIPFRIISPIRNTSLHDVCGPQLIPRAVNDKLTETAPRITSWGQIVRRWVPRAEVNPCTTRRWTESKNTLGRLLMPANYGQDATWGVTQEPTQVVIAFPASALRERHTCTRSAPLHRLAMEFHIILYHTSSELSSQLLIHFRTCSINVHDLNLDYIVTSPHRYWVKKIGFM